MNKVTLFTKECCSLCDSALFVIEKLRRRYDFDLELIDITEPGNAKWFALYCHEIPVVHVNGREVCRNRVHERRLREALQGEYAPDRCETASEVRSESVAESDGMQTHSGIE